MRKDSNKRKYMHSLSVSVCPCVSETVCANAFRMGIFVRIALTSFYVLTRLKTAGSTSWGSSPTNVLTQNTCFPGICWGLYVKNMLNDCGTFVDPKQYGHSLSQVSPLYPSAQSHIQVVSLSVPPFWQVRSQPAIAQTLLIINTTHIQW